MQPGQIPYGHTSLPVRLPDTLAVDWIEPAYIAPAPDPAGVVRAALAAPVDGMTLSSFRGARSVAIAINDKTRPVPHEHLLPPLLDALAVLGIPAERITLLIATGTHLPMPADEFSRILPAEIIARYPVISHNCDDPDGLVPLGLTDSGTPVTANSLFMAADLRIVVGNIEPHHFAGFSGGYKSAAIGLTGRETINANHAMLVAPGAHIGVVAENPLRQDIEQIGARMGVHFALNAILNGEKKIVAALSGHPAAVLQAGIPISSAVCQVSGYAPRSYDLVIASAGGAPKDINFYQAQKALTHASLFARDGGVIILAAACPEGTGSQSYEQFMAGARSPQDVFEQFRALGFRVGPHKALQVARDAARVQIVLVSEIPAGLVAGLLMTPAASLDAAIAYALDHLSPAPSLPLRVAVLPRATNTIPAG